MRVCVRVCACVHLYREIPGVCVHARERECVCACVCVIQKRPMNMKRDVCT